MKFQLSEEDAATYGCPREVEFDESRLTGREAIALKKQTGWSLERLGQATTGDRVLDDDGNQVWQLDEAGDPELDEAGQKIPLRSIDPECLLVMAWLAVRRSVGDVSWKDFDINLVAFSQVVEDDDGGKAPTTSGTA